MEYRLENGLLQFESDGTLHAFQAHAELSRPTLLGWGIKAGGRCWSSREPHIKIEKHSSIQEIARGNDMIAWYIQEFLPYGEDYKVTKNAWIYLGILSTGEQRLLYKGECYGDLCFDGTDLYFNMGNKLAVMDITSGEYTVLFKHSGIKKNDLSLHITAKRIFFVHWTHSSYHLMWYDRTTKTVIDPHVGTPHYYFLDENTIIYHGLDHAWTLNLNTLKKKRFFQKKTQMQILQMVCDFLQIPTAEYDNMWFCIELLHHENGLLYFQCAAHFRSLTTQYDEKAEKEECIQRNLPEIFRVEICCALDGTDVQIPVAQTDIIKTEKEKRETETISWRAVIHSRLKAK